MGERVELISEDGFRFAGYRARPVGPAKGGVVVIQEIFGVNAHIRDVADGFAEQGYLTLAPQIYDRIEPNVELGYEGDDVQRGRDIRAELGFDTPVRDIAAAVRLLRADVAKVGTVGYCYGGALAWLTAARIPGLDAAVGYYGTAANFAEEAPACPVMLHYGEKDAMIPASDADDLKARYPEIETFVYPADHGFNCDMRASYDAESASLAYERTLEFFGKHLG